MLASKEKPDDLSMGYLITLIAKYYYSDDIDVETLSDIVKKILFQFNIPFYQEYKYHNKITKICIDICCNAVDRSFREAEYVPVYENEINLVNSLPNDRQRKLMFTFFAVARYMNCDGWINKKTSRDIAEVFRLANVNVPTRIRNEILHELYTGGYIIFSKSITNSNIKVNLDDTGAIAYKVKEFCNIGHQYLGNFKQGYKQCTVCGKPIKITNNRVKYCTACYKRINGDDAKNRMRRHRDKENVTF